MASNQWKQQGPRRATQRDALTGAPLTASLHIVSRDYGGTRDNPKAIPNKIHTSQMVTVEGLEDASYNIGHQDWDKRFQRYMRDVKPYEAEEAIRLWYRWYTEPYLVGRVARHFAPRDALHPVLALYRDEWEWADVYAEFGKEISWVERQYARMTAFIRFCYLLDERKMLAEYQAAHTITLHS